MSVEDQPQPSSLTAGGKSDDASQVRIHPVNPSSDSLEDGEIMEGRISAQLQLNGQPRSCSSKVEAATPVLITPVPAVSPAPTVEPSMTKEDLDRAKSLVLDLLGWGVTPEYLVECGLSPGAIYRIFTDLQLRLPTNLEVLSLVQSHRGAP